MTQQSSSDVVFPSQLTRFIDMTITPTSVMAPFIPFLYSALGKKVFCPSVSQTGSWPGLTCLTERDLGRNLSFVQATHDNSSRFHERHHRMFIARRLNNLLSVHPRDGKLCDAMPYMGKTTNPTFYSQVGNGTQDR